jgi:hypothetical protein
MSHTPMLLFSGGSENETHTRTNIMYIFQTDRRGR